MSIPRESGGVAESQPALPLKRVLGIDASWEVIKGDSAFYQCTKKCTIPCREEG
jgi:trehalose synthase